MEIGCHISIRDGFLAAAQTARHLGIRAFQYFPKNPRSLESKGFNVKDAQAAGEFCKKHQMLTIAHSPYPVNMASVDENGAVVRSILHDLHICEACGSIGLVVHFGKFKGKDLLQGYKNILQCLNKVLSLWEGKTVLLIENESGQGTSIGLQLEESVQLRKLSDYPEKIAFCFDSCHAYVSGALPQQTEKDAFMSGFNQEYWKHVKAVHLNDSIFAYRSKRDQHANIGEGHIPFSYFEWFAEYFSEVEIPFVLETPLSKKGDTREELEHVKRLLLQ